MTTSKIMEDITLAQIFTIMMDETTDVSEKEQASTMVRFVDRISSKNV